MTQSGRASGLTDCIFHHSLIVKLLRERNINFETAIGQTADRPDRDPVIALFKNAIPQRSKANNIMNSSAEDYNSFSKNFGSAYYFWMTNQKKNQ
jgi:hypothetical protein